MITSSIGYHNGYTEEEWTEPDTGMKFVMLRKNSFQIRSVSDEEISGEKGTKTVHLDDFRLGKYEVTQGEWKEIMGSNPSY